jgi:hypothetical protein
VFGSCPPESVTRSVFGVADSSGVGASEASGAATESADGVLLSVGIEPGVELEVGVALGVELEVGVAVGVELEVGVAVGVELALSEGEGELTTPTHSLLVIVLVSKVTAPLMANS